MTLTKKPNGDYYHHQYKRKIYNLYFYTLSIYTFMILLFYILTSKSIKNILLTRLVIYYSDIKTK